MKKAFSTKLLALFVLVLTVAALVVVSSAATWGDPATTGYITTGEIVGATIDVKTTADNGDGTYTVVFDVNVADGYMIEDYDLHDGYIPLEPVVIVKEHQADGSFNRVVIEKVEKGEYKDNYVVKNWNTNCDIEVECVKPVTITIDGANYTDFVFEQDGHIYVLNNVANYATIVILNSQTDYTKAKLDGLAVDDYGHITDGVNGSKSYFASVKATGTFANMAEANLVFAYGQDFDAATRSGEVNTASMVSAEAWFAGRYLIFGQSTSDFVNRGNIIVGTRSVYMDAANLYNYGNITVTYDTVTGSVVSRLYVNANLINEGTIDVINSQLYVGGGAYKFTYDADAVAFVSTQVKTTLTNKATINLQGGKLSAYILVNEANAVIDGTVFEYINGITGKAASAGCDLVLTAAEFVDDKFTTSINKGTITLASDNKTAFDVVSLNNSGKISVTGKKVAAAVSGLLNNSGEFVYDVVEADFELKYTSGTFTKVSDLGKWELYDNIIFWSTPYGRNDGGKRWAHVNCHDNSDPGECVRNGDGNHTCFEATKKNIVRPFGIENSGTMVIKGISTGADNASFKNGGAYIINYGDFTLDMEVRNNFTQFAQVEVNGNGADWRTTAAWATTKNYDVENYGTFNFGGSNGSVINIAYLYNAEDAIVNINGKYEVKSYDGAASGTRMEFVKGLVEVFAVDSEFINYGTVNVSNKGVLVNWGDVINGGVINVAGVIDNYDWIYVEKTGNVINDGIINNGDADHVCDGSLVKCNHVGLLEIAGTLTNNSKLLNDWNSDIRIEGTLDNVNGLITNCGMIVNVGTFTTTVEGLDNQFAVNGYDITYVNKAETDAPADDKEDTKDTADGNAADTNAPTKTPAAQTSDIAVAGLAIIATLSLAGVVVAKKVR